MNTKDFFEFLYPNLSVSGQVIEIRPIRVADNIPDLSERLFSNDISKIINHSDKLDKNGSFHVFFECPMLKSSARRGIKSNISGFSFLYADIDPKKKDATGNIIKEFTKKELLERINKFPIEPSVIVDSGNGFHCYWSLLFPIKNIQVASNLLDAICFNIGGDNNAIRTTQLLRVPYTHNRKNGKASLCKVVSFNDKRYSLDVFYNNLNMENVPKNIGNRTDQEYIETKASIKFNFSNPEKRKKIKIDEYDAFLDTIKKQDIFKGTNLSGYPLGKAFNCCFHNDTHPSANIFRTKEGHYLYNCFACGVTYDIITLYQKSKKVNFFTALDELAVYYGIDYSLSDWVKSQILKYHFNAQWLGGIEKNKQQQQFPFLFKILNDKIHYLRMLNSYAQEKPITTSLMHENESVFFLSYEFLTAYGHNQNVRSVTTAYRNIKVLIALGLIERISLDELSLEVQMTAKKQVTKKSEELSFLKKVSAEPVSFYKIPLFQNKLIEAEKRAKRMVESGVLKRNISKETFILTLGQEIADDIYNDDRTISKENTLLASHLKKTLIKLIETEGYATKKIIATKTKLPGRMKFSNEDKIKEIEKRLSFWIKELDLDYHKALKIEKEKFSLKSQIYIITKKMS